MSDSEAVLEGLGEARRAPVQAERGRPAGSVAWAEHERAWQGYQAQIRSYQSAERIAERGGFGYSELVRYLGAQPLTWMPR
jgi:hypothetical protein